MSELAVAIQFIVAMAAIVALSYLVVIAAYQKDIQRRIERVEQKEPEPPLDVLDHEFRILEDEVARREARAHPTAIDIKAHEEMIRRYKSRMDSIQPFKGPR